MSGFKSKLHLGGYTVIFAWTVAEYLWNFIDKTRDQLQASLSIVKKFIFTNHWRYGFFFMITIPPKWAAKDKRKLHGWNISMQKAPDYTHPCVSNSGSPPSLIMCKAHFHIEIRLLCKCGGAWGHGPVADLLLKKNGQLHCFDWGAFWRRTKASALSEPAVFYASVLFISLTLACF